MNIIIAELLKHRDFKPQITGSNPHKGGWSSLLSSYMPLHHYRRYNDDVIYTIMKSSILEYNFNLIWNHWCEQMCINNVILEIIVSKITFDFIPKCVRHLSECKWRGLITTYYICNKISRCINYYTIKWFY